MYRNKQALGICAAFLVVCIRCATEHSIAGGGTVVTNSNVIGLLVNDQGTPVAQAAVLLVPDDYDPVRDSAVSVAQAFTDIHGRYVFHGAPVDTYTIQALDVTSGAQALITGIHATADTTLVTTGIVSPPGNIQVVFADSTDTSGGYVYIKGTTLYTDFLTVDLFTGNRYAILLESVPAAQLPAILFATRERSTAPIVLEPTVTVLPHDTIFIGDIDSTLKPLWQFSCIVAVTEQTSSYYGGLAAIRTLIADQIQSALSKFNNTDNFKGALSFVIDSIYQFSTDVHDEIDKPLTGFDYRLVYNAYSSSGNGYWYDTARTIYMEWSSTGLFSENNTAILTWMFGMARGCLGLNWLNVKAEYNPVNSQAYNGIRSIMNWCYDETVWDDFSIHAINYSAETVVGPPVLLSIAYPATMGAVVTSATGIPVEGALVDFYGVRKNSYAVDTPAVVSGLTDASGEYILNDNPFHSISVDSLPYLNFLVRATHLNDTAYCWMPFHEVGNAWFSDPDSDYKVRIHF